MEFQDIRDEPDHAAATPITTTITSPLIHAVPVAVPCDNKTIHPPYEILPGLWIHLGPNSSVTKTPLSAYSSLSSYSSYTAAEIQSSFRLSVCSDVITLVLEEYDDLIPFMRMTNVSLSGNVVVSGDSNNNNNTKTRPDIVVNNLSVTIDEVVLNHLTAENCLERYGSARSSRQPSASSNNNNNNNNNHLTAKHRLQRFLARYGHQPNPTPTISSDDIHIPKAQVQSLNITILNDTTQTTIPFPHCAGSPTCTLRTLISYYTQSILQQISPSSSKTGLADATSDVTSVVGRANGALVGAVLLGPVGAVAGSFYGGYLGRKYSRRAIAAGDGVVEGGEMVFGPVVGAETEAETRRRVDDRRTITTTTTKTTAAVARSNGTCADNHQSVGTNVRNHLSSNKYEYAGSTGVMVGAAAGVVLGPVGVAAGAFAGALSGRRIVKAVDEASSAEGGVGGGNHDVGGMTSRRTVNTAAADMEETEGKKPYRFGDKTRGLIAKGKQSRGVQDDQPYKFGDFTRGLFK